MSRVLGCRENMGLSQQDDSYGFGLPELSDSRYFLYDLERIDPEIRVESSNFIVAIPEIHFSHNSCLREALISTFALVSEQ